jgi:hypothetical protein
MQIKDGFALAQYINRFKQKAVPNQYASAREAAKAWCDGQLWGNPIVLSENNVHVYGCYRRNWTRVMVWFRKDYIVVVKPPVE